ncbi:MAG: hypothetical protein JW866_07765 [Ignavibacteriales bacterium]|nr:hypothetical protein [Ignavibacteriales bacterium]
MTDDTYLSSSITVIKYLRLEKEKKQDPIAEFIFERFYERYLRPFESNDKRNGFSMLAVGCLMIEALESFYQGWIKSPNSALSFEYFFDRNLEFNPLRTYHQDFYKHIRCAILHQGETTNGWKICRKKNKPLFDPTTKTINADNFHNALNISLKNYSEALKTQKWEDEMWLKFRKKIKAICNET